MDPGEQSSAGPAAFRVMRAHLYVPRARRRWRMLRTLIKRLNILSHWAWRTAGRARQRGLFNNAPTPMPTDPRMSRYGLYGPRAVCHRRTAQSTTFRPPLGQYADSLRPYADNPELTPHENYWAAFSAPRPQVGRGYCARRPLP